MSFPQVKKRLKCHNTHMKIEKTHDKNYHEVYLLHTDSYTYDLSKPTGLSIANEELRRGKSEQESEAILLALSLEKQKHLQTADLLESVINERNILERQLAMANNTITALTKGHKSGSIVYGLEQLAQHP